MKGNVPRRLSTVISEFSTRVSETRALVADVYSWSIPTPPSSRPLINRRRRDSLTALAFLQAFAAWEAFLEEAFILYLIGQQAPRGRKISRLGFPPTSTAAYEWVSDGRDYATWSPDKVKPRAERFFRGGRPFSPALSRRTFLLRNMTTVRNAIAHESARAQQRFESLVRNELGTVPPRTTVGSFLAATKPGTTPPISFVDYYLNELSHMAQEIVPN